MDGESSSAIQAKFVSKKISKIRWKPTNQLVVEQPSLLVTGSWDEEDSRNSVDLWTIDPSRLINEYPENPDDNYDVPLHLHSFEHFGDVTDLLFLNDDRILVSSSSGNVTLLQHEVDSEKLVEANVWGGLHRFRSDQAAAPCTSIASRNEGTFVSVGEDGRLNVVDMESGRPDGISTLENADSTSLTGVCFLRQKEVAAVNAIGQFKIWDLRRSTSDPAKVLVLNVISGSPVALQCLDQHPTQPHIVATGGQNGDLYIWDMRQDKAPATLVTCHQSDIWEVRFHPTHPNSLFTCSNDGSVFHWANSLQKPGTYGKPQASSRSSGLATGSTSSARKSQLFQKGRLGLLEGNVESETSWMMDETTSNDRLIVRDLIPGHDMSINSLDIVGSSLVCGTDAEEILLFQKLDVF